jgi:hypothetical protein
VPQDNGGSALHTCLRFPGRTPGSP